MEKLIKILSPAPFWARLDVRGRCGELSRERERSTLGAIYVYVMIFSSTRSGWSVTVLGYMQKVRVVLFDGRLEKLTKIISPTPFWAKLLISLIVSITALVNER